MTIDTNEVLKHMAKLIGLEEGKYYLFYKSSGIKVGSISVDEEGNVKSSSHYPEDLVPLFMSQYTEIRKAEPAPVNYIYLDENLAFVEKEDRGDAVDKLNRDTHNYFKADEFTKNSLAVQMKQHIVNMRLNLLSNFCPAPEA